MKTLTSCKCRAVIWDEFQVQSVKCRRRPVYYHTRPNATLHATLSLRLKVASCPSSNLVGPTGYVTPLLSRLCFRRHKKTGPAIRLGHLPAVDKYPKNHQFQQRCFCSTSRTSYRIVLPISRLNISYWVTDLR